ncbi:dihydroneopterin aldolase [Caloranaerobacter azorensis]|uniref:7,8-dihydroneopterin aldolase n=1 Tax=Caloranaerobacter azorensis TaxID=116090 RepID=A0A6P1YEA5_9FIRM|nr:dihydroneopterin aldolase [Caloranaerobacter azorensis]QIB27407.1 dihydroneopterin aldolase [Caloranaerobacter azorensis]
MDKIMLKGLNFYAYHGALKEENVIGQKFIIDLELFCDLKKAGETDDLSQSVNYAKVYEMVKGICENNTFKLIEALAENIAVKVLDEFKNVKEIVVRVKKPQAPVNGIFDYFGVEIRRVRSDG